MNKKKIIVDAVDVIVLLVVAVGVVAAAVAIGVVAVVVLVLIVIQGPRIAPTREPEYFEANIYQKWCHEAENSTNMGTKIH